MTEDEAKRLWCPFARVPNVATADPLPSYPLNRWPDGIPPAARCLASGCMAWRWWTEDHQRELHGYCGLAGRP